MKLCILVIGNHGPSLLGFRGDLIKLMISLGHNVHVSVPLDDLSEAETLNFYRQVTELGATVHVVELSRAAFSVFSDAKYFGKLRAKIVEVKPDRIFAFSIKPVVYGGLARRSLGFTEFYPMFPGLGYTFTAEKGLRRRLARGLVTHLLRVALKNAKAIIFQNKDDEALLRELGIVKAGQTTRVIDGSGVNLVRFSHRPLTEQKPISFLMVSRLLVDKGIRHFAAAAAELKAMYPETRFLLLGPLDSVNPAAPTQAEVNSWNAVEYLGSKPDVRPYLQQSTVFVLPSFYREGIPRASLEALATGRAIITTDSPGCRETVIDGQNGFIIKPRDTQSLVEAMARFIENPNLCVGMGESSYILAQERFDVVKVNRKMLEYMNIS